MANFHILHMQWLLSCCKKITILMNSTQNHQEWSIFKFGWNSSMTNCRNRPKWLILKLWWHFGMTVDLNSSQKVKKLFLLDFFGKCVGFWQLTFVSLESPCVYLSNDDISSITIGYFRAKIRHFELNMVRSQTKCAKIQHCECWPVNPPFKDNGVKRMIIALRRCQWQELPIQMLTSHIHDAVGGLTHKQLT